MRDLHGKTALITGASRGIGLAIARRLVEEGARVCVTARKPEALAEAVEALGGPAHAIGVPGKADDAAHQAEAVARTVEAFGSLDVLVNNAGVNPAYGRMLDLEDSAFRKVFEVNVISALAWVREAHKAWLGEHGGSVVNVASVAGLGPASMIGAYAASKAALIQLTAQLADELSPLIRVNAVAPAVVKTDFAAALYEGREEKVARGYALGRLGMPDDIAGAVSFLASGDAGWITGQTLVVDGGLLLKAGF